MDFDVMVKFVMDQFHNNQFLIGGIGTIVFGALAYLARNIPYTIYLWIRRATTCEFTINTRNESFDDILAFLYKTRVQFFSRNYSIGRRDARLMPGYGWSFGWYCGRPITFRKYQLEAKNHIEEQVTMTFFTRKLDIIEKFLKDATVKRDSSKVRIYIDGGDGWWRPLADRASRSINTVFLNKTTKDHLMEKLKWFYENEAWYNERGIPYKLCILLHGEPGTGKTSLIYALASEFKKNIRYVSSLMKISELIAEVEGDNEFVVIEDIDTLSKLERDEADGEKKSGLSESIGNSILHKMLNTLDGFQTPHGAVIIMTTNHPQKLDAALTRVGRIDVNLEIGRLGSVEILEMFESFYGKDKSHLMQKVIADGLVYPTPGSHLQSLFANNTAEDAVAQYLKERAKYDRPETKRSVRFTDANLQQSDYQQTGNTRAA